MDELPKEEELLKAGWWAAGRMVVAFSKLGCESLSVLAKEDV